MIDVQSTPPDGWNFAVMRAVLSTLDSVHPVAIMGVARKEGGPCN